MEIATPDVVLDSLKRKMKKEKETDQTRLASLVQTKANFVKMGDYEAWLKELCARITEIQNFIKIHILG
jgi:hypothetical protein